MNSPKISAQAQQHWPPPPTRQNDSLPIYDVSFSKALLNDLQHPQRRKDKQHVPGGNDKTISLAMFGKVEGNDRTTPNRSDHLDLSQILTHPLHQSAIRNLSSSKLGSDPALQNRPTR